jgi:flavin-binding protein dodecin
MLFIIIIIIIIIIVYQYYIYLHRYHGKERRKETASINSSLMCLKECIRARAIGQTLSHQFRRNKLTMALKGSFFLSTARTIVIACISPSSKDTEHSINTLRHACIMNGHDNNNNNDDHYHQQHSASSASENDDGLISSSKIITEMIGEINLTKISKQNLLLKKNGGILDEPKTNNGNNSNDSKAARLANSEIELTAKDKLRIRRNAEKNSIQKMDITIREILKFSRKQIGKNEIQLRRLQRKDEIDEIDMYNDSNNTVVGDNNDDGDDDGNNDYHGDNVIYDKMVNHDIHGNTDDDDDGNIVDESVSMIQPLNSPSFLTNNNHHNVFHEEGKEEEEEVEEEIEEEFHHNHHYHRLSSKDQQITLSPINIKNNNYNNNDNIKKTNFIAIYHSIFDVCDEIPSNILRKQLDSILLIQGYHLNEIESYLSEYKEQLLSGQQQSKSNVNINNSYDDRNNLNSISNNNNNINKNKIERRKSYDMNGSNNNNLSSGSVVKHTMEVLTKGENDDNYRVSGSSSSSSSSGRSSNSSSGRSSSSSSIVNNNNKTLRGSSRIILKATTATANAPTNSNSTVTTTNKAIITSTPPPSSSSSSAAAAAAAVSTASIHINTMEKIELKRQQGLIEAAKQIEDQTNLRKYRQDMAKKIKDQKEQERLNKIMKHTNNPQTLLVRSSTATTTTTTTSSSSSSSTNDSNYNYSDNNNNNNNNKVPYSSSPIINTTTTTSTIHHNNPDVMNINNNIQQLEHRINQLQHELLQISQQQQQHQPNNSSNSNNNNNNSLQAIQHAIKKNIALTKATLLKVRRNASQQGYHLDLQELAATATALSPSSLPSLEAAAAITDQQRNLNYITRKDYSSSNNNDHNRRRSDDVSSNSSYYDELDGSAMRMMMMNKNVERNVTNSTPLKSSQSQHKIHTPPQRKIMINHDEYSNQQYHQQQQQQQQQHHVNHSPRVNNSIKNFTEDRIPIDINDVNTSSSMINHHHHQDRRKHIGAAAAPFANEYSWQVDN